MTKCAICSTEGLEPVFEKSIEASEWMLDNVRYGYVRCPKCLFVQCNPIPSADVLSSFYERTYAYEWFYKNAYYKRLQAKHRVFKIRKTLGAGLKCLDFGCGHGFFVKAMLQKGDNCSGFDIGVEKIEQKGDPHIAYRSDFESYDGTGFDIITAWHAIEHMRDPNKTVDQLIARLNSGGKLIIAVPNLNSLGFRLFQQKWGWIQQPYVHINHFSSANLAQLLRNHDLEIIAIKTHDTWDQNLYDLLITRLFYMNRSRNPVREFNKSARGNLAFRINQLARLAFTPLSYLVSYLRQSRMEGSELLIIARKA